MAKHMFYDKLLSQAGVKIVLLTAHPVSSDKRFSEILLKHDIYIPKFRSVSSIAQNEKKLNRKLQENIDNSTRI